MHAAKRASSKQEPNNETPETELKGAKIKHFGKAELHGEATFGGSANIQLQMNNIDINCVLFVWHSVPFLPRQAESCTAKSPHLTPWKA